jgi:MFS family permease
MMIARYSGARMARMMSLVSMPVLIAPIFGPSLAGAILHVASWHWLFFLNLPVGVAAIILASILLPKDDFLKPRRLDWLGFLLVSPGLVFLLHGLNRMSTRTTGSKGLYELELLAAVILLAIFFVRGLKKGSSGLIDLRLFLTGNFPKSAMTQFLGNAVTQGGQMLIPLYLLTAQGLSPGLVGILIAPMGIGLLCSRPFIEKVVRNYGPRRVSITGATICTLATLPFALPNVMMVPTLVAGILLVRGFGLGMVNLPSLVSAYSMVPKASLTDAATALNIVQRLGGPGATMSLALILQYASGIHGPEATTSALSQTAFSAAFALLCLINLACILAASRLPSKLSS